MGDPLRRVGSIAGIVAGALASVVALPSLAFPFGHDQGLYFYVGREWLAHGAIPYRDVLEQKPPAIFLLHALAIALFGERVMGVRVLELLAVVALGLLAAELAPRRPAGIRGASVLAACIFYYGFFNFWDTAQCEIWVALFVVAAMASIRRIRSTGIATCVSGVACGVALVFKPPALFLVVACAGFLWSRSRSPRALAAFVALALIPWAVLVAYFASVGALAAFWDVFVRANAYYARHEPASTNPIELAWRAMTFTRLWGTLGFCVAFASILAWHRARRRGDSVTARGYVTAGWLALAAMAGVWTQAKFYYYHWALFVAPWTVAVACLVSDVHGLALRRRWRWPASGVVAASTVLLWLTTNSFESPWFAGAKPAALAAFEHSSRDEVDSYFRIDGLGYSARDDHHVADWLAAHAEPEDRVAVRGFAPEIYALAHRRFGGRFFWTLFLTLPTRAYRRSEWLAQDRDDLERIKPRFVVALREDHSGGPSSPQLFEQLGWVRREDIGMFEILELQPRL